MTSTTSCASTSRAQSPWQPHLTRIPLSRSNERGTTIYKVQKRFQAIFGFTLPFFHGRGVFNCSSSTPFASLRSLTDETCFPPTLIDNLGLMPYRHPIVTVGTSPSSF